MRTKTGHAKRLDYAFPRNQESRRAAFLDCDTSHHIWCTRSGTTVFPNDDTATNFHCAFPTSLPPREPRDSDAPAANARAATPSPVRDLFSLLVDEQPLCHVLQHVNNRNRFLHISLGFICVFNFFDPNRLPATGSY